MLRYTYSGCLVNSFRGPFSAREYAQWCKHSVATHCDTVNPCLTQHDRTEAMIKSQTERGKRAMISVAFLSPSKHGPLTISITARPLIYRCITTSHTSQLIPSSYNNHTPIILPSTSHNLTVVSRLPERLNYFMNNGSLEFRRVVW